jgi:hypothetical protein
MPSTYTLIKGETLASSAASYTFTAIPSTFTDLVLRISARGDLANPFENALLTFNSDSATNYSRTLLYVDSGTSVSSVRTANTTNANTYLSATGSTATSNTFGSAEIYISNYTSTTSKPISGFGVAEQNTTQEQIAAGAYLYRNTTAISSILVAPSGSNWVTGSSFYLYGIKSS